MITCLIQTNKKLVRIQNEIILSPDSNCRGCVYNTGIQCHGHNDYWATCSLYEKLREQYSSSFNRKYDEYNIISDGSKCMVYKKLIEISKEGELKWFI